MAGEANNKQEKVEVKISGTRGASVEAAADTPASATETDPPATKHLADDGVSIMDILKELAKETRLFAPDPGTNILTNNDSTCLRRLNVAPDGTITVTANNENANALTPEIAAMIVKGLMQKYQGMEVKQANGNDFGLLLEAHREWVVAKAADEYGSEQDPVKRAAAIKALFQQHPFQISTSVKATVQGTQSLYQESMEAAIQSFSGAAPTQDKFGVAAADPDTVRATPAVHAPKIDEAKAKKIINELAYKLKNSGTEDAEGNKVIQEVPKDPSVTADGLTVTFAPETDRSTVKRVLTLDPEKQEITIQKNGGRSILTQKVADFLVKLAAELGWGEIVIDNKLTEASENALQKAIDSFNTRNPGAPRLLFRCEAEDGAEGKALTFKGTSPTDELTPGERTKAALATSLRRIDKLPKARQEVASGIFAALAPGRKRVVEGFPEVPSTLKTESIQVLKIDNKDDPLFKQFITLLQNTVKEEDLDDVKDLEKIPENGNKPAVTLENGATTATLEQCLVAYYVDAEGNKQILGGASVAFSAHKDKEQADALVGYLSTLPGEQSRGVLEALKADVVKRAEDFYKEKIGKNGGPAVYLLGEVTDARQQTLKETLENAQSNILDTDWQAAVGMMGGRLLDIGYKYYYPADEEICTDYRLAIVPGNEKAVDELRGKKALPAADVMRHTRVLRNYYNEGGDEPEEITKMYDGIEKRVDVGLLSALQEARKNRKVLNWEANRITSSRGLSLDSEVEQSMETLGKKYDADQVKRANTKRTSSPTLS